MSPRYPDTRLARLALAPGILAAIMLLAAVALVGTDWFTFFRYAISILAAIVGVFAYQARQRWWIVPLAAIVVLWNPVVPIDIAAPVWRVLHLVAAVVFVAAGILVRVPQPSEHSRR